jgi:hypothetical protein
LSVIWSSNHSLMRYDENWALSATATSNQRGNPIWTPSDQRQDKRVNGWTCSAVSIRAMSFQPRCGVSAASKAWRTASSSRTSDKAPERPNACAPALLRLPLRLSKTNRQREIKVRNRQWRFPIRWERDALALFDPMGPYSVMEAVPEALRQLLRVENTTRLGESAIYSVRPLVNYAQYS